MARILVTQGGLWDWRLAQGVVRQYRQCIGIGLSFQLLAEAPAMAGCVSIGLGIESGSLTMLKEMRKHTTVEQARNAIRWSWEAGIKPGPSFLIGMPGETEQTIRESTEFRKEINRYLARANENTFWVAPLPGTELYAHCKQVGLITDDLEYITRYGDIHKIWNFFMNLTKLSDDKIKALKAQAQKEIFWDFYRKHPGKFFGQFLWPRLLRYAGAELPMRAIRKGLKIYRRREFLRKGYEAPTRVLTGTRLGSQTSEQVGG